MLLSSNELDMLILQHGKDGTSADSKYIWVKYAQDKNGTGLTDDPTNAVYIGIAYNKTEKHESDNPNDYTWTRIKGNDGESAYTVILQNENITFSVSNQNNIALMDQSFDTSVVVFKGTDAVSNFTIGTVESKNGISVIQKNNTITFSVEAGNKIEADYGKFSIPISVNGLVFKKEVSWSLAKAGAVGGQGNPGEPALSISLGNESQNIPCTYDGHVINDMLIEISFVGYRGLTRTPCNVAVGTLPSGMTLGSIENCTISNDGSIILNIVKNATLGTESTLTGNIVLTFSINGKTLVKNFTWTKSKDGGLSYIYSIEPSSYVINKTYDGTLSPASITFNAYYQKDGSDRIPYNGLFTIEESTTGSDFKSTYLSSKNESSLIYTPTSNNIKSVRCTLSQADKVSVVLDRQTVIVLSDDKMKDALTTVTTRVNGVSSKVDGIDKKITNKVWQTDITTAVNNYDGTTVKSLRDQVSSQETKIGEITSEVSDVKTTIENNQASVQKDIASMKQDATGFKQTVASTYETKNDASTKYSSFDQRAGKIETSVKTLQGNVTTLSQTDTEIKAELKTAKGDITTLKSDASGLSTKITNAQGDINTLKSDASSMKSDISDAKGNISTLQRTSSNLQSQITNNKTDINILTGDPMNYSKLNESTSDYWGFTYDGTADGRWYTMKTLSRDKFISGYYECMGGESFNIEFEISTSVKGNSTNGGTDSTYKGTAIGLYGFDAQKQSVGINYSTRTTATAAAPATKISSVVSVPANSRYFRVFLQTESWGNFSGTLKIRNVIVSRIKAIETRMSSAETSIRQNANDISLRATNVQLEQAKKDINGKFADYSTTSEMNSAIKVKADSITQEVSKTYTKQTDFNSLYIGGRNLALTTSNAYSSGYSNFSGIQNTCVFTANVLTDGLNVGDTITVRILYKYTNIVPTAGQTALVWLQGQGNVTGWHSGAFPGSSSIAISGSGEYELLYTATINSDHLKNSYWDTMFRHDYVQSGTVQWKMYKVEKGNRHSEWSPAPEDTSTAITKVEQTATSIRADLKNTQGDVSSLQATASGLQTNVANAQNDISKLQQTASNLSASLSNTKGDVSNLQSTASGLQASISNAQGDINTLKSDASSMKTQISNAQGDISILQQTANSFQIQLNGKADQVDSFNWNLVPNSHRMNNQWYNAGGYVGTTTVVSDPDALCGYHIEMKCTTGGAGPYFGVFGKTPDKIGKTYTWSFWAKCSVNKTVGTVGHECGGQKSITLTTSWQKYSMTWKYIDYEYSAFVFYNTFYTGEILYIRDFKIEEGSIATKWAPAESDLKGDKGDKGDTGAAGPQGPQGVAGKDANQVVHTVNGNGETNLYVEFATIKITGAYANQPTTFKLGGRGFEITDVQFSFAPGNTIDPGLDFLRSSGGWPLWIYKKATSTWGLITRLNEPWGHLRVFNYTQGSGPYTVMWTSTKLASLPSGSINANPLQAAKTATNFMQFTDGTGLEVGNKTSGSWSGYRTKISASAFEILNRAGTTLAYYGDKLIQLGKNAKDAVIELCGGVGKILVETKSGNAALSIQSEYVDIKGVHESVLETSSSSGSCIAGAVDDSFVVNTYSDANNKANFDIGNGSIILESKKKGYQAEVEFYGCGWSGGVYTGAFAPTKAYSEKIMLGDSGRVWERLIVKNSPQVTSDRRAKTNIFPLGESKINKTDIHSELFDRLKPVQYRMIDGDGRICYGFVAQDVVEAMRELGIREDELDLVHHDRKNTEDGYIDTYSMVYTNLIAVITHELQLEKERRSNLEIEVADLRSELESMRDNISGDTN